MKKRIPSTALALLPLLAWSIAGYSDPIVYHGGSNQRPQQERSQAAAAEGKESAAEESAAEESAAVPPRLSEIKTIYVEEMPNDLHTYIAAEIVKKFKGRLQLVNSKELADAILTGTGEHQEGTGAAITGRFLGLHDTASAAVMLLDKSEKHILWADEAGDRSIWWGALARGGPRKVASRLIKHLDKAIKEDRKAARKR